MFIGCFPCLMDEIFLVDFRLLLITPPSPLPQSKSFGLSENLLGWGPVSYICMRLALLPGLSASFSRVQPPGTAPIFIICHWPKYSAINKRLYSR